MSSSSSSSYRRYNQDVSNKTHCDCKPPHPIPIQTAWTTDNPGRRFRGCPIRDKSKKCGVYGFLDLELPSDYYKGLVYSLHEENKALKRMNRMPVGVMDDTSGVVSNNSFADIGNVADIGNNPNIIFTLTLAVFTYFSVDQYGQRQRQSTRICCNVGSSKSLVPPFGSPERPRPDVTPRIAESFKSRPCHPELIRMYVYQSTDYDYWNTWVQDESTDEEDEDEVMTTKDDDLLFYQDTFPVDKFVPYGKAMGSKRIEKSPTIPGAVLGLCNTLTWVEIEKKLRKKPPMKH
ncbi:hypothetical protein Tco_0992327 [Tanacetum coccineum]|uniref:Zinc finger GRF-type domain-containing protein n=1 Tax=Tanacetum coccineum TaxID=301880 RepID=A0ABQ5F2J6_9ASTR